jgi:hypothetical protein
MIIAHGAAPAGVLSLGSFLDPRVLTGRLSFLAGADNDPSDERTWLISGLNDLCELSLGEIQ